MVSDILPAVATDATSYEQIGEEPLVVTGLVEETGGVEGSDGLWLLRYALRPWRLPQGPVVRGVLRLWLSCSDRATLADRLDRLPLPGSCVELRVRRTDRIAGLERPPSPFDAELVSLLQGEAPDPELLRVADELRGDEGEDDVMVELERPSPVRVVRRAHALASVVARARIELDGAEGSSSEGEARLRRVRGWLRAQSVVLGELEQAERELVDAPLGSLERRSLVDATWRAEGLAVLAWALGVAELPDHETPCDVEQVTAAIGFLEDEPAAQLRSASLQSPEQLVWMAARLLGLHWRLRDFRLAPRALDFRAFARQCWFGSFDLQDIPLAGDDLSIGGVPIDEAAPELVDRCTSIALERHRAINWLLGFHPVYSEVDIST